MMVLVDTSAWSLAFRKGKPSNHVVVDQLRALLTENEDVVITGLILQEILQAFRSDAQFQKVSRYFDSFPLLETRRPEYIAAARLHRTCASKGIAASTVDCQIAAAAISHKCRLLSADKDFERIATVSDLKLF